MKISFYIQDGPWIYSASNSLLKMEMAEPGLKKKKKILRGNSLQKELKQRKLPRTSLAHKHLLNNHCCL